MWDIYKLYLKVKIEDRFLLPHSFVTSMAARLSTKDVVGMITNDSDSGSELDLSEKVGNSLSFKNTLLQDVQNFDFLIKNLVNCT